MRSVSARGGAGDSLVRGGGRIKSDARKGGARSNARGTTLPRVEPPTGQFARFMRHIRAAPVLRRPMLALTLLLVLLCAASGLWNSGHISATFGAAATGAGFGVEQIALAGNERTPADAVYSALGVGQGESIFTLDPDTARARLIRMPWVADAVVRRRFPDAVSVTLIEKRPFALWRSGSALEVVERSGAVIAGADVRSFAHLPVLLGANAPQTAAPLIDALAGTRAVKARVRALERISDRRWDLLLDRGVRIKLPEDGWETQLAELERLIVDKGILERDIEMIDLRYPDSYIFQLHNGESHPVSRERPA